MSPPRCFFRATDYSKPSHVRESTSSTLPKREREFFIDNLLVRIHLIMSQMFLVDRLRAMGV